MFTTAATTCTATGAASAALVSAAARTAVVSGTCSVIRPWYGFDGFGVPMNHKRPSRRPPSPTS